MMHLLRQCKDMLLFDYVEQFGVDTFLLHYVQQNNWTRRIYKVDAKQIQCKEVCGVSNCGHCLNLFIISLLIFVLRIIRTERYWVKFIGHVKGIEIVLFVLQNNCF